MNFKKYSVLVIDDDPDILTAVRLLLKHEVKEVVVEKRPEHIPGLLSKSDFDLVMLDMNFNSSVNTGNEGIYWLRKIKELKPGIAVILITAYGDIDLAVRSLKEGAADFVIKPWSNARLLETMEEAIRKKGDKTGKKNQKESSRENELLGGSEAMQDILYKINKVAPTDANILILGENGTGKDLIAKAIHQQSQRAAMPFIKIDVGALTDSLFESELFGHKKGAFTDARDDREGRFEAANGGTLFLDEIGNITLQQQAKLLTALQNRTITRLGSNQPIPVNIRLLCATNVSLSELANDTRFRKDLIYRINTVEIIVPPLRKRGDDIELLANHFAKVYGDKYLKQQITFTKRAIAKLQQYQFPGNVRELQYIIERAVIMAESELLDDNDLTFSPIESSVQDNEHATETRLSNIEKNTILRVIEKNDGNITRAARELGITRTALYRRLGKYDI